MRKPFNWKIYFILLAASIVGVVAAIPYSLAVQGTTLSELNVPMPTWLLLLLQILQNAIMFAVIILLGLLAANRVGLGLPVLEAKLQGKAVGQRIRSFVLLSIVIGIVGSVLIVLLDSLLFMPRLMVELGEKAATLNQEALQPAAWKGLLASFYGGIDEELLLRLGLMSILVWLGSFVSKTEEGSPTLAVLWSANILAAVLFGLGHLPATAALFPLSPLVILRAVTLNGLLGIAFGYLYFKHGLEAAMLSHFTADIVLHVLLAL
jgi:Type II CAAX prenyl endopeptidase Rce1-like